MADLREGAVTQSGRDEAVRRQRELLELFERVERIGGDIMRVAEAFWY